MFVVGLAYRGTAHNGAIQRLLHFAVSDVSDDVRRAAVMNLGFVLMGNPEQCPRIVSLLAESFNPHVRYGRQLFITVQAFAEQHGMPLDQRHFLYQRRSRVVRGMGNTWEHAAYSPEFKSGWSLHSTVLVAA
jgi:hypothetical protein